MSDGQKAAAAKSPLELGERVKLRGEAAIVTWVSENTAKVGFLIFTRSDEVENNGAPHTRSEILDLDAEEAPKVESLG